MNINQIIDELKRVVEDGGYRMSFLSSKFGFYRDLPDEEYLRRLFKASHRREPDLKSPKTCCEKLLWLKLNDRDPVHTTMVDKYAVKEYVKERIGEQFVIPAYGVWDSFDDIDFDSLPDQFVLKCTHNSGSIVVCKDKKHFDREKAKKKLNGALKKNYYWGKREWPYKDVPPRILAEKYVDSLGNHNSYEYKIFCCNGTAKMITICRGIAHSALCARTNDHFDRDLNYLPFHAYYKNSQEGPDIPKPPQLEKLLELSDELSAGHKLVRVDWYINDGHILFGEFTFFTWGGTLKFTPDKWDEILGKYIPL